MPTRTVHSVHEAKTHLSRLIADALAGEDVVIARGKEPVVRLVPVAGKPRRKPGTLQGKIDIGPAFFDPLPEDELALWEGGDKD